MFDQTPAPRWSKADTHCVWCGKPRATDEELDAVYDDGGHSTACPSGCWCMLCCWGDCDAYEWGTDEADVARALRASVEAQGKVIEQIRTDVPALLKRVDAAFSNTSSGDGIVHVSEVDGLYAIYEWAEQLYGSVVNEEAGDGPGPISETASEPRGGSSAPESGDVA